MIYDVLTNGIHKLKVTLQSYDFVGHIFTEIGGNCHGKNILDFDFECETEFDGKYMSNDCDLKYDEDTDTFSTTLTNNKGEKLVLEYLSDEEMHEMIVGLEIIDFIPTQE